MARVDVAALCQDFVMHRCEIAEPRARNCSRRALSHYSKLMQSICCRLGSRRRTHSSAFQRLTLASSQRSPTVWSTPTIDAVDAALGSAGTFCKSCL